MKTQMKSGEKFALRQTKNSRHTKKCDFTMSDFLFPLESKHRSHTTAMSSQIFALLCFEDRSSEIAMQFYTFPATLLNHLECSQEKSSTLFVHARWLGGDTKNYCHAFNIKLMHEVSLTLPTLLIAHPKPNSVHFPPVRHLPRANL